MKPRDRVLALKWWRAMKHDDQVKLSRKHFPRYPEGAIMASSMRIEQMHKAETKRK